MRGRHGSQTRLQAYRPSVQDSQIIRLWVKLLEARLVSAVSFNGSHTQRYPIWHFFGST